MTLNIHSGGYGLFWFSIFLLNIIYHITIVTFTHRQKMGHVPKDKLCCGLFSHEQGCSAHALPSSIYVETNLSCSGFYSAHTKLLRFVNLLLSYAFIKQFLVSMPGPPKFARPSLVEMQPSLANIFYFPHLLSNLNPIFKQNLFCMQKTLLTVYLVNDTYRSNFKMSRFFMYGCISVSIEITSGKFGVFYKLSSFVKI